VYERLTLRGNDGAALGVYVQRPAEERGIPLILLHGASSNHTRWWHFGAHSTLRHQHAMLCPDLRGHGDSLWRGPATMDHWCDDLGALLDSQRIKRTILVGHCLGANLAIRVATRLPHRCAGLVLIEPMLRPALRGTLARLSHLAPLLALLIEFTRLANRLGLYRRELHRVDLQQLDREWHSSRQSANMADRYGSPWHDLKVVPTAQYLANLVGVLTPPPLDAVRCPVLAILPQGKRMTDPEQTRRELARLPIVDMVELEADHWIPTRQPDALVDAIDGWVKALQERE
jgi:esterase